MLLHMHVTGRPDTHTKTMLRKGCLRSFVRWLAIGVVLVWSLAALTLLAARWIDPPTTAARNIDRQQAARLAAILPAPLKRRPERMNNYSAIILKRMGQMGW